MDADFWRRKWERREIGFHEGEPNRLLAAHWSALGLAPTARVFLPLCGKTRDIAWFLARGSRVVGAELSAQAIAELFDELGAAPTITRSGDHERWSGPGIDVVVGDFFALEAAQLGAIDAVYDRAALVALPEAMRELYVERLEALTAAAPQLLVTFEYDQAVMPGPPFSLDLAAVERLYGARYAIAPLVARPVEGGLKGRCPAIERALWLAPRFSA